ncbi:MAG: DNA translocase FtsK 4TM domain-containing protein [Chloroflexi bacterium]|nr:DNA translocase FtsK 4TM domain-containing protein [Chloroflexota bacterium]
MSALDRRLDILGFVLVALGGFALLGLIAATPGSLTYKLTFLIRQGFGWGAYVVPLVVVALGAWLILRQFRDSLPHPGTGRVLGAVLLYFNLLAVFHAVLDAFGTATLLEHAEFGRGGGYAGALLLVALLRLFDWSGTIFVLVAWFLVGLILALRISLTDILRVLARAGGWIAARMSALREPTPQPSSSLPSPLAPPPAASAAAPEAHPPHAAPSRAEVSPAKPPAAQPPAPGLPARAIGVPELPPWNLPDVTQMLNPGVEASASDDFDRQRARLIEETLASFGAPVRVVEVNRGPTITQFGVEPDFVEVRGGKRTRVKVSKIGALADDLALALAAPSIRLQTPVPGKGYVGIEVPNSEISLVSLRDVIESEAFHKKSSPLRFALGQDVSGHPVVGDLATMPHLLIAGTTGSGKSVCVNALISCFLLHNTPDTLRFLMVDPKRVELTSYNGIPHLLAPVIVEIERVVGALQWVTREMDERYRRFAKAGARNLDDFNSKAAALGEKRLPSWVVVIDELADLMLMAPDETERILTRLAQLSRATGIHLVIATQRPSVDVLTGLIKANFPARISFAVASMVDSRVVLDQPGAERLLGRGDMLFQAPDSPAPVRLQGAYVSEAELVHLVNYWRQSNQARQAQLGEARRDLAPEGEEGPAVDRASSAFPPDVHLEQAPLWEETPAKGEDALQEKAIHIVRLWRKASTTRLQRHFRIGYTRAARLMDALEERGIIGPPQPGAQPREVIDYGDEGSEGPEDDDDEQ